MEDILRPTERSASPRLRNGRDHRSIKNNGKPGLEKCIPLSTLRIAFKSFLLTWIRTRAALRPAIKKVNRRGQLETPLRLIMSEKQERDFAAAALRYWFYRLDSVTPGFGHSLRDTSAHAGCSPDTTLLVVLVVVVLVVVVVAKMLVVMSTLVAATSRTTVAIDVGNGARGSIRGTKSIQILTAGGPWLSIGKVTWPQLELISLRFAHRRTDHYDQHDEHG
uniref:Uncharacterized protein n=1 Tax=Anopheles farauti TaxID=69004 RepID=A0A182QGT1_9DIPT